MTPVFSRRRFFAAVAAMPVLIKAPLPDPLIRVIVPMSFHSRRRKVTVPWTFERTMSYGVMGERR